MATAGGIGRRCRCRDKDGKDLGAKCPKLKKVPDHGTWYIQQELEKEGKARKIFRRGSYTSSDDAQDDFDKVRALISLAAGNQEDLHTITKLLLDLDRGDAIPEADAVKTLMRSKDVLDSKMTVGEWLDRWYAQCQVLYKQKRLRKKTLNSYESQIRLYLKPKIGHIRLDRLTVDDLIEMFSKIADDNDAISAANDDRRAKMAEIKMARKMDERSLLREQLAEMAPLRRTVSLNSQGRILAALRASLNSAIAQRIPIFNPASYYSVGAKPPKPMIWTEERVERWRQTGKRPGSVMVWTPVQAGEFMDYVHVHDPEYEGMWHLLVHRGPRRGETAAVSWTEAHLKDLTKASVEIITQLTEVDGVVVEGPPKSDAGIRTVPLDIEGATLLLQQQNRQSGWRLALGPAWIDSGRIFTYDDGSALRPRWISDRFKQLYTAAGLPPIRLHDLRHTAATLMIAAKIDMKVIQETLGHSNYAVTADIYSSVLPEVAQAAAEATAAIVPRKTAATPMGDPMEHPKIIPEGTAGAQPRARITRRSPKRSTTDIKKVETIDT